MEKNLRDSVEVNSVFTLKFLSLDGTHVCRKYSLQSPPIFCSIKKY